MNQMGTKHSMDRDLKSLEGRDSLQSSVDARVR